MSRSETRAAPAGGEIERLRAALQEQKASAVRGRDEDRSAIARELHDRFGQYLTVMELELGAITGRGDLPPLLAARLDAMRALTAQAQQDMAQIAWQMRPAALEGMDLKTACEQLVADWRGRSGLSFDLHLSLGARSLPAGVAATLYRVLQEAITNAVKHANAGRIGIILRAAEREAVLIVEDDGSGFSADAPGAGRGAPGSFGLLGMRERLALVAGTLEIESAAGQGATLLIRVPL